MKLIAKKSLRYGGKEVREGDVFEASDKHGKVLKAIKKAADADPSADAARKSRPRGTPAGRTGRMEFPEQPKSSGEVSSAAASPLTTDGGVYGRRDMRAQD